MAPSANLGAMKFKTLLDQLESDPRKKHKKGREFELLCQWYLSNAPHYRDRFEDVWLWSEWPDRPYGDEAGIDLVARESGGAYWAIQAKAYDPASAIPKEEIDSFISEATSSKFDQRLLIATTDRIGRRAVRMMDAHDPPVLRELRSSLENAEVEWPTSLTELRPKRPRPKRPRRHQLRAVAEVATRFGSFDRGQLIMACGTGKTLTALWIAERLEAHRTLLLVPSLSLLGQTLRAWTANATQPFESLLVCSDETVAGEDHWVSHTGELGLPVTSDAGEIAAFLRRRGRRVVFSTYQSSPQVAAAFASRTPYFDLAIADEAHRCAGPVGTGFSTILDPGRIKARRRLFMTATPRFYTSRIQREAGQEGVDIASMDDEAAFGPVLHKLTFGEAIDRDLLSDYQVAVVGVDDEMYREYAKRGEFVTRDNGRVDNARTLASQIGLADAIRRYDLARTITFHGRVKAARVFSNEMPGVVAWMPPQARPHGRIWSEHVAGSMGSGHRDRLLARFESLGSDERGILSNARCLGEGVDLPTLDGVAFIDPRRSPIDIIQAVGRAIRKAEDKSIGTIVIPVFVESEADPDVALRASQFDRVWDVLKALRAHDEQLGEELDALRRRQGALGPPGRPGKVRLDLPRHVGEEFARAFDARLVESTTEGWEFMFGALLRYIEVYGDALVPALHRDEQGNRLGSWVNTQRTWRSQGRLTAEREARLDALNAWVWDAREAQWEEGFAHLQRYAAKRGDARVPQAYVVVDSTENGYPLGSWLRTQRAAKRDGKLDPSRERRLAALDRSWYSGQDHDAKWMEGLVLLERYARDHGDVLVHGNHVVDGFKLGEWLRRQRALLKRGKLSSERKDALDAAVAGWERDKFEVRWQRGFDALRQFVARENHANVPAKHLEGEFPLGRWVNRQRVAFKNGTLAVERRELLESDRHWTWEGR